jgi:DNA-binding MarR family transcriptional regulator
MSTHLLLMTLVPDLVSGGGWSCGRGGPGRHGIRGLHLPRLYFKLKTDRVTTSSVQDRSAMIDAETTVTDRPKDHHVELRLWLRLLTCSTMIEREIRRRLADSFDTTLPRFDLMAQLYKMRSGLTLGELSQRLMVSNGNMTGLVERLVEGGLVAREQSQEDRRKHVIRLTDEGERQFTAMAAAHGDWVAEMLAGMDTGQIERLMELLGSAKASVAGATVPRGRGKAG